MTRRRFPTLVWTRAIRRWNANRREVIAFSPGWDKNLQWTSSPGKEDIGAFVIPVKDLDWQPMDRYFPELPIENDPTTSAGSAFVFQVFLMSFCFLTLKLYVFIGFSALLVASFVRMTVSPPDQTKF